jgi:hypothetical protein
MRPSIFSYNISRPYPFKWFTPVVFIGGLIAALLLSVLNFVSNGYYLSVEISTNPNSTITQGIWFANWPSFLTSKVQPTCQSVGIPINSQFYTNQTGLTYTLTKIWQPTSNPENINISPSLIYHNNILEDCKTNAIVMNIQALDQLPGQFSWNEWAADVLAYITCSINGESGRTMFNLTTNYNLVPQDASFPDNSAYTAHDESTLFSFVSRDKETRASLWWGETLLSMYWISLSYALQVIRWDDTQSGTPAIRKGAISFTPNHAAAKVGNPNVPSAADITKLDYFNIDYRFIVQTSFNDFDVIWPGPINITTSNVSSDNTYPNIWIPADRLAKSLQSVIMTDLGQTSSTFPNILTNATTLEYFTSDMKNIVPGEIKNVHPIPAQQDYLSLRSETGPLIVTPSVIISNYICQVPRRKPVGEIFVSVLLADLVFLQALWKLLRLYTETFLLRKKLGPRVNYCEGCLRDDTLHTSQAPVGAVSARAKPTSDETGEKESRQKLLEKSSP